MTIDPSLLRTIIQSPDADEPRLVCADWLEEHGDSERAEFIRGQIRLARWKDDTPERRALAFRVRQLLERHEKQWRGSEFQLTFDTRFCRGFIEKAGLLPEELKESADELFGAAPLRRLWISDLFGEVDSLRLIPTSNQLTGLDLSNNALDTAALRALATFSHLNHLQSLNLQFNQIDDEGASFLRAHPFFEQLTSIRCGANPMSPQARQSLIDRFGSRVSFDCARDADHWYAFQNDYFTVGLGRDHTQLLLSRGDEIARLAVFDHEGNLLEVQQRVVPYVQGADWRQRNSDWTAFKERWLDEVGYQPATIKVKRFRFDNGAGITDFPWWRQVYERPNDPELPAMRESIERWLVNGQFQYDFVGDNCWIDGDGEVTDT